MRIQKALSLGEGLGEASFVNEEKPSGTYEINFNDEGLTSGVYFYRLQIADLSQTKKVILIR
jgi:hypothetical protein